MAVVYCEERHVLMLLGLQARVDRVGVLHRDSVALHLAEADLEVLSAHAAIVLGADGVCEDGAHFPEEDKREQDEEKERLEEGKGHLRIKLIDKTQKVSQVKKEREKNGRQGG